MYKRQDDDGSQVVIDGDGVVINGEHVDSWRDAHERYGYGHIHEERWYEPCGYTVNGERFDTLDDAKAKYGPEVGRTIPVRKHYLRAFEKEWVKFPYPLVIIVAVSYTHLRCRSRQGPFRSTLPPWMSRCRAHTRTCLLYTSRCV